MGHHGVLRGLAIADPIHLEPAQLEGIANAASQQ
jgi:hypothetical protein